MDDHETPATLTLREERARSLNDLWLDPEVIEGREAALRRRLRAPEQAPAALRHEVADDLLSGPLAAARALGRAHEDWTPPEPLAAAYERAKTDKARPLREAWALAHDETDESIAPLRVHVAWRLVREHARLKNLVADDEALAEALGLDTSLPGDPWRLDTSFTAPRGRAMGGARLTGAAWDALDILQGLPLLPPIVPERSPDMGTRWRCEETLQILDTYDPAKDERYLHWLEGMVEIAHYLGVGRRGEHGATGTDGMFDRERARLVWPSRYAIVAVEAFLVEETLTELVKSGIPGCIEMLDERYGLTRKEAAVLVKLAKGAARERVEGDVEESRALMQLRLEDYVGRATLALNLQAEMHGLKLLSLVQGLGKTKPEDILVDFIEVVGRVAGERRARDVALPGEDGVRLIDAGASSDRDFEAARAAANFVERE